MNGCPQGDTRIGVRWRKLRRRDIEDYYFTPWDLGLRELRQVDHDFVGREALERMAEGEHRQKVTLALDDDSVTRDDRDDAAGRTKRAKFIDWPSAVYSMHPFDRVTVDSETVGISTWVGYSANEGKLLTLAAPRRGVRGTGHGRDVRLG